MDELFRMEAESQTQLLTTSLLALERDPKAEEHLEACMRAAHSLKGAARLVGVAAAADITHAMEDCFVGAQRGEIVLNGRQIDFLLDGVDLLGRTANPPAGVTGDDLQTEAKSFVALLAAQLAPDLGTTETSPTQLKLTAVTAERTPVETNQTIVAPDDHRVLRVTAENFNRLLGLAGESLVQSRWLKPYLSSLLRLKQLHREIAVMLDGLQDMKDGSPFDATARSTRREMKARVLECQDVLTERLAELQTFDSGSTDLARRLYDEALACRMRPFADGVAGFPKMVRGLARSLGKEVRLELAGAATQVDRDVLESLESPLTHLLRNAIDHGIELPANRLAAGKVTEGLVRLEASHRAGMLQIVVADDGGGVVLDQLRIAIVTRNLAQQIVADKLTDAELLEFLFLPGFTMKAKVTEISGRGVGLDAVQTMVKLIRGTIRVTSQQGQGTRFELRLPVTLSVVRTLQAEVGGEIYAFPLAQIMRAVKLPRKEIVIIEGKPHIRTAGRFAGLIDASQLLGGHAPTVDQESIPVILIEESGTAYGLVVDRFVGERDTVVQPLDSRFGKIADVMAGGVMEDGSPVLIVNVLDIIRSVEKLIAGDMLQGPPRNEATTPQRARKRVLVVDDSLTVRELERKLLDHAGYVVETAVDGMEGWNIARTGNFDLIITDVDMPRMDGIELVRLIKQDPHLRSLPVMIVSYKDKESDQRRGLEAGADRYLLKKGFQGETLLQSVTDLIGDPLR
jgi:two-component system sensor histidine kinase and response regulator WspE